VAVGSFWSTPHLLDFGGAPVSSPAAPTHGPNALAVRGRELLVGCDSGVVLTVDLDTLDGPGPPSGRARSLTTGPILSLHADQEQVFAGTYSGHVLGGLDGPVPSPGLDAPVPSVLRTGGVVVGGTYNGEMVALDPGSLDVVHRGRPHEGSVKSMAGLRGDLFVSCATDRIVAAGTLRERVPLWEHGNLVNSVSTLDGSVVASASRDHTVKVGWVAVGCAGRPRLEESVTLLGPDESVKSVTLLGTAEAPVVLAGSYDFGLYCWPLRRSGTGRPDAVRSGTLVTTFGQAVSHLCRIDPVTAAVAAWDGQVTIVRLHDRAVKVVARLSVAELIGRHQGTGA